jgi:hypothetical protein
VKNVAPLQLHNQDGKITDGVLEIRSLMETEISRVITDKLSRSKMPSVPALQRGVSDPPASMPERQYSNTGLYYSDDDDEQSANLFGADADNDSQTDQEEQRPSSGDHGAFLLPPSGGDSGKAGFDGEALEPIQEATETGSLDVSRLSLADDRQTADEAVPESHLAMTVLVDAAPPTAQQPTVDRRVVITSALPPSIVFQSQLPRIQPNVVDKVTQAAYERAQVAQQMFRLLGAKNVRFMSLEAFTQILYRALIRKYATTAAPENDFSSKIITADDLDASILQRHADGNGPAGSLNTATVLGLVKLLARGKKYLDFVDFVLIYQEITQGGQVWNNEPARVISCDK